MFCSGTPVVRPFYFVFCLKGVLPLISSIPTPTFHTSYLFLMVSLQISCPNTEPHASILPFPRPSRASQPRDPLTVCTARTTHLAGPWHYLLLPASAFPVACQEPESFVQASEHPACSKYGAQCVSALLIGRHPHSLSESSILL